MAPRRPGLGPDVVKLAEALTRRPDTGGGVVAARAARSAGTLDDTASLGYRVAPGHRIEIEIQQANGVHARVVGTIGRTPLAAGGEALQLMVTDATVTTVPVKG
jgi:hypothetical protein